MEKTRVDWLTGQQGGSIINDCKTLKHPGATLTQEWASLEQMPEGLSMSGIPMALLSRVASEKTTSVDSTLPQVSKHAASFLEDAVATMRARAVQRDAVGSGERSMARAVTIFNAWTDNKLSTEDGWRFMIALKQAREIQGKYNEDDYVDAAAYFGLLGEEESGNSARKKV